MSSRQIATVLVTTLLASKSPDESISLHCEGCAQTEDVWDFNGDLATQISLVQNLIDHAQFDHTSHCGVGVARRIELLSAFELSRMLGVEPRTEHEAKWREAHPIEPQ